MGKSERGIGGIDRIPVGELRFSPRTYNCLSKAGIRNVGQLRSRTAPELLKLKLFAAGCLKEVRRTLGGLGTQLKEDPPYLSEEASRSRDRLRRFLHAVCQRQWIVEAMAAGHFGRNEVADMMMHELNSAIAKDVMDG